MGIKLDEAFQSNYIAKGDLPILATISKVDFEMVGGEDEPKERKVVVHSLQFPLRPDGERKGLIINKTNWINIEEVYGGDTDGWEHKQIEVYVDASIMYGGKRVGGVRVRIPSGAAPAAGPALLGWPEAQAAVAAVNISYDELVAALKAQGRKGYDPARDTALVRGLIAAQVQPAEQNFETVPPEADDIPF